MPRHTLNLSGAQWSVVGVGAVLGGLFVGVVGLAFGADYGGNFCNRCEFNGLTGYEATGQVGFLVAAPLGFVLTAWLTQVLLLRRNAKRDSASTR